MKLVENDAVVGRRLRRDKKTQKSGEMMREEVPCVLIAVG